MPELLAVIRRGPFAPPTQPEKLKYLLTRTHKSPSWTSFADYGLEHVLSYQRRVLSIKAEFLQRCVRTPLGICHDYWDRTEAALSYLMYTLPLRLPAILSSSACCVFAHARALRLSNEALSMHTFSCGIKEGRRQKLGLHSRPYQEQRRAPNTSSGQAPRQSPTCRAFRRTRAIILLSAGVEVSIRLWKR